MNYERFKHAVDVVKGDTVERLVALPQRSSRWTISYRAIAPLAMAADALLIFATSVLSGIVYHLATVGHSGDVVQFTGIAAVIAALFIALGNSRGSYTMTQLLNFKLQLVRVIFHWLIICLFLAMVAFAMKVGDEFSRGTTFSFAVFGLIALIGARVVWRLLLDEGLAVRRFSGRKIVLITEKAAEVESGLVQTLTRHGLQLAQHFVLPANQNHLRRRRDVISQVIASVRGSDVEEIVVGANPDHWQQLNDLLSELRVLPVPVNFVPVGPVSELFKLSAHKIGDTVTIELQRAPLTSAELIAKRAFDIVVAALVLIVHLPIFLIVALVIKLDSPGPILFRQRRCGFNGQQFRILKFRTMSVMDDGDTIIPAQPRDPRVTRVGRWLRNTSIDELPQLVNVLSGTMSIVGPRPHAVAHDTQFEKVVAAYAFRNHVKPGLTGWAQVHGLRGHMRTVTDVEQRTQYDLWYIANWTFAVDCKIMAMTLVELLRGEKAY